MNCMEQRSEPSQLQSGKQGQMEATETVDGAVAIRNQATASSPAAQPRPEAKQRLLQSPWRGRSSGSLKWL